MKSFSSPALTAAALTLSLPALAILSDTFSTFENTTYDFVIVGGMPSFLACPVQNATNAVHHSNAGAVLANRLTENPRWKVLLIEAGPSHEGILDTKAGLNNRVIKFPRGKLLGGCSSMDGMFYTRGSSSDWDRWANVTEDEGWSWKQMLPYFLKNEYWTAPADGHNDTGEYTSSFHGTTGLTNVSSYNYPQAIDEKILEASKELGGIYAYDEDINDGEVSGIGWSHSTIGGGERSSAATSYLSPDVLKRNNLHILVGHRVTHVVNITSEDGLPSLRTVRFTPEVSIPVGPGPVHKVSASKEVILSAGVVGSTQILLLSGIGNATELASRGIDSLIDLPGVGKNVSEQAIFFSVYALGVPGTVAASTPETEQAWISEWNETRTGPLTSIGVNMIFWFRIPEESPLWDEYTDPASGKNTPHVEVGFDGGSFNPTPRSTIANAIIPLQPESRGSITLASSSPFDSPLIDFAFFDSRLDLLTVIEGIRSVHHFYTTSNAFQVYNLSLVPDFPSLDDDAALEAYVRNTADHAAHPVGTAAMTARDADWGVVGPDLRLKGAVGLRVVDASVMVRTYRLATLKRQVYAIAERAADLIKVAWGFRN
ncbi:pyranose dehydrogenase [Coprinellus micaceus]|uniref:pyranose dehydrogenase (acceptor) n=1 Tax=Coprinellus micaceus TaxID=71717 RepID=A0A4Y7SX43_COPMI|nr:pyranose dehydrogenase [Coprinellus micaceus]